MAFKIKRSIPLLFEGTIDPGKKLETPKNTKIAGSTGRGNGKRTGNVDSFLNDANNDGNMITRAVSKLQQKRAENIKAYQDKKNPKVSVSETKKSIEGSGASGGSSTKGTPSDKRTYNPFVKTPPPPPNGKKQETIVPPPEETKASGRQSKLSQTSLGKSKTKENTLDAINKVSMKSPGKNKKSAPQENTLDAINKVSMKKFVPASKKTTTVKAAPKDNSRKAIKKRKTADKKAGVSK